MGMTRGAGDTRISHERYACLTSRLQAVSCKSFGDAYAFIDSPAASLLVPHLVCWHVLNALSFDKSLHNAFGCASVPTFGQGSVLPFSGQQFVE